jgi:four helix bundle protein
MVYSRFEEIPVWQKARVFNKEIFELTLRDRFNTDYKFRDQIRSSAGSIMDNIAEGFERDGNKEFINFLHYSKGSCGETRSQLYRAFDYGYISRNELEEHYKKAIEISKELKGFITYLNKSGMDGIKYKK